LTSDHSPDGEKVYFNKLSLGFPRVNMGRSKRNAAACNLQTFRNIRRRLLAVELLEGRELLASTLYYSLNSQVYSMLDDGSANNSLFAGEMPVVSPNGQYVAFRRGTQTNTYFNNLLLRDLTTGLETQLSAGTNGSIVGYNFTPDSQRVVFDYSGDIRFVDVKSLMTTVLSSVNALDDAPSIRSSDGRMAAHSNTGLLLFNPEGTGRTSIPNTVNKDYWPVWSPDGQWLSFYRTVATNVFEYYKIRPDGTDLTQLSTSSGINALSPVDSRAIWSPDGTQLFIAGTRSGVSGVYSLPANGTLLPTVVRDTGSVPQFISGLFDPAFVSNSTNVVLASSNSNPAFGSSLTFTATVSSANTLPTGNAIFTIDGSYSQTVALTSGVATLSTNKLLAGLHNVQVVYQGASNLSISSASISQSVQSSPLTSNARVAYSVNGKIHISSLDGSSDTEVTIGNVPRISPNGRYLVFHRGNQTLYQQELWVRDLQTGVEWIASPATTGLIVGYDFSNDSRSIVFDWGSEIRTVPLDVQSTTTLQVNGSNGADDAPATNPIDGRIAYHNDRVGNGLFIRNPGSSVRTFIPNTQPGDYYPAWSPDGQWLVFSRWTSTLNNFAGYFKIRPDGTGLTELANTSAITLPPGTTANGMATWSPDGNAIIVSGTVAGESGLYQFTANPSGPLVATPLLLTNSYVPVSPMSAVPAQATVASSDVQLALSSSSIAFGSSATLTATVNSTAGIPAGNVVFRVDGSTVATVPLNALGIASTTISNLSAGTHSIVADYLGNATTMGNASTSHLVVTSTPSLSAGVKVFYSLGSLVHVSDVDGTGEQLLTVGEQARLSPDGRYLAFKRKSGVTDAFAMDLWVRDLTTNVETQIFTNSSADLQHFDWTAGGQIVFDYTGTVRRINRDGTGSVTLISGDGFNDGPSINKVDGRIALWNQRSGGTNGIFVANADGSVLTKVPNTQLNDYWPVWSPDGQWIAFQRLGVGSQGHYKIRPDGTDLTQLSDSAVVNSQSTSFEWQGTNNLLISGIVNSVSGVYRVAADGSSMPSGGTLFLLTGNVASSIGTVNASTQQVAGATIRWTSSASSTWTTASNWDLGRVPGPNDQVVIPDVNTAGANVTITFNAPFVQVAGVTVTERLTIAGGTLSIQGNLSTSGSGTITLNGGILENATITAGTVVSTNGATSSYTGSLSSVTINGTFNATSRTDIVGGITIGASGVLNVPSNSVRFDTPQSITGNGTVVLNNSSLTSTSTTSPIEVTIGSGITVRGGNNATIGWAGMRVTNRGTIQANVATALSINAGYLANFGTLKATGATLNINAAHWENTGSLISETGGTINLGGYFRSSDIANRTFVGTGVYNLTGSVANAGSNLVLNATTGPLNLAGGTIVSGTITTNGTNDITITGATFGYLDGVVLNGSARTSNANADLRIRGNLTLNGTITLTNSYFSFEGTNSLEIQKLQTTSSGTIQLTNTTSDTFLRQLGTFHTVTLDSGVSLTGGNVRIVGDDGAKWINRGRITMNGATAKFTVYSPVLFENASGGIVETMNSGTVALNGNWTNFGSITSAASLTLAGTVSSNAGTITTTGGSLTTGGMWSNQGTISVANTVVTLGGQFSQFQMGIASPAVGQGTFLRSGGSVTLAGTLIGNLTLDAATGPWTYGGNGTIRNGTISSSSIFTSAGGFTFDNVGIAAGTIVQQVGSGNYTLNVVNGLVVNGEFQLGTSAAYTSVTLGGTQTLGGSGAVIFGDYSTGAGTVTTNTGSTPITITFGPSLTIRGRTGTFSGQRSSTNYINEGLIQPNVAGGVISFTTFVASVVNQGTIQPINSTTVTIAGGSFTNEGTILVSSSNAFSITTSNFTNTNSITATGGSLTLGGTWSNTGNISVANTTVTLAGAFTQYGMGIATPAPGQGTFIRSGGTLTLNGILTGDLTLDSATGPWFFGGSGRLVNGTLNSASTFTSSGPFTFDNLVVSSGTVVQSVGGGNYALELVNNLTLNGEVRIGTGATSSVLRWGGSQTISGSGSFVFGDSGANTISTSGTGAKTVTIGPDVEIVGKNGIIGFSGGSINYIFQGLIQPNIAGGILTINGSSVSLSSQSLVKPVNSSSVVLGTGTGTLTSLGTIEATASSSITINPGTFNHQGILTSVDSTLTIAGNWTNTGNINVSNSTVNLGGSFTQYGMGDASPVPGQGTFVRSGGVLNLTGTANGNVLLTSTTGLWNLATNGRFRNGTIDSFATLNQTGGFTFDNATIAAGTSIQLAGGGSYTTTITNGLSVHGELLIGSASAYATLLAPTTQTIGGTGYVTFGSSNSNTFRTTGTGITITFGPSLTLRGTRVTLEGSVSGTETASFVFQGTVQPNVAGGLFTIAGPRTTVTNQGTINAGSGASVTISSLQFTNTGMIQVTSGNTINLTPTTLVNSNSVVATGGALTLGGNWSNTGTISVTNTEVTLGGTFTQAAMGIASPSVGQGTFLRSGGTVTITGAVTGNINLDASTGPWILGTGGSFTNNTISSTVQVIQTGNFSFSGVTIAAGANIFAAGGLTAQYLTITNGLTIHGQLTLGNSAGAQLGALRFSGTQSVLGTGNIFSDYGSNISTSATGFTITFGPSLVLAGIAPLTFDGTGASTTYILQGAMQPTADGFLVGSTVSSFVNQGLIHPTNAAVNINSVAFNNQGTIHAGVNATVSTTPTTTFSNLSITTTISSSTENNNRFCTLSGGNYIVDDGGAWILSIGTTTTPRFFINRLAANVTLNGPNSMIGRSAIDTSALAFLSEISTGGKLELTGGRRLPLYRKLNVDGTLLVDSASSIGSFDVSPVSRVPSLLYEANGSPRDTADGLEFYNSFYLATRTGGSDYATGVEGLAFSLDGIDDAIEVPYRPSITAFSGWFQFDSQPITPQTLLSKPIGNGATETFRIWYENQQLKFGVTTLTGFVSGTTNYVPVPGQWTHVAMTYQNSGIGLNFYLDGKLRSTTPSVTWVNDTNPFVIGADRTGSTYSNLFQGNIDIVRFDNALSDVEIDALFHDGAVSARAIAKFPGENHVRDTVSGFDASAQNGVTFTPGILGNAFQLDGTDDYLRIPSNQALEPSHFAMDAWVYFDAVPTARATLVSKSLGAGAENSYSVWYEAGQLHYGISDGATASNSIAFTPAIGVWKHIAVTFDDLNNQLALYIDGQLLSTLNTTRSIGYSESDVMVGADENANSVSGFFPGRIDQLRFFSTSLEAATIAQLYREGIFNTSIAASYAAEGNANDSTAANQGTLLNGTTFTSGMVGQAFSFDGTDDLVEVPDSPSLRPSNFSIELWYQALSTTSTHLLKKRFGAGTLLSYALRHDVAGTVTFQFTNGSLLSSVVSPPSTVGAWNHVVATFDDANNAARVYMNGVGGTESSFSFSIPYDAQSLTFGGDTTVRSGSLAKFRGNLDEVKIFDRVLTPEEITARFMDAGALRITQTNATVTVDGYMGEPTRYTQSAGTLGGSGYFPTSLTQSGGVFQPGNSPGCPTVNGNYGLGANGMLMMEANGGIACSEYDQLIVNGTVTLAGSLDFVRAPAFIPSVGDQFTIINNDLTDPVTGTFVDLPNHDVLVIGSNQLFQIDYDGGDGNDVVLTYLGQGVVVTSSADSGPGSLRQAIIDTNATVGAETIAFAIPPSELSNGRYLIQLSNNALPVVSDQTRFNGTTQAGYSNAPIVEVRGNAAARFIIGATGAFSEFRGLAITNASVGIESLADNVIVSGNYIGLVPDGTVMGNATGILINSPSGNFNYIGGTTASERNIISGNSGAGIRIQNSSLHSLYGNYIGTSPNGLVAIPNGGNAIELSDAADINIGSSDANAKNVIVGLSAATTGISITNGTGNRIRGNWIGLNATGTAAIGNLGNGISIQNSSLNLIDQNRLVNYSSQGLVLSGAGSNFNEIELNYFGIAPNGTTSLMAQPNTATGIAIVNAPDNKIGDVITIVGRTTEYIQQPNVIGGNQTGILVEGNGSLNTRIYANLIGLNASGTAAIPNYRGIVVNGARATQIGSFTTVEYNTISGNSIGTVVSGTSDDTRITANRYGTDLFGGASPGIPNTIYGVEIDGGSRTVVLGNTVVRSGTVGLPTNNSGIYVHGGNVSLSRNLIYRNVGPSITVSNSTASIQLTQARIDGYALGTIANATPNTTYTIEFFAADQQGQSQVYIGSYAVVTDEAGAAVFEASNLGDLPPGQYLTATITGATQTGGEFLLTSPLAQGVLPTAAIIRGLPSRSPEGQPISLKAFGITSSINGYSITGYRWVVLKDALPYVTGAEAGIQFAPDDEGVYSVTLELTLTNALGDVQNSTLGPHTINVFNVAPTPQFDYSPSLPRIGQLITLRSNSSDNGLLDILSYSWEVRANSLTGPIVHSTVSSTNPSAAITSFTPSAGGNYYATLRIDDSDGGATGFRTLTRVIAVKGLPSTLLLIAPTTGSEGKTVRVRIPEAELNRAEEFSFAWTLTKTPINGPSDSYPFTIPSRGVIEFTPNDDGNYIAGLTMTEIATGTNILATPRTVTVTNASPVVSVQSASNTSSINTPIQATAVINDPGKVDTHTITWTVSRNGQLIPGAGTVGIPPENFSFTPLRGGVYTIEAIATDDDFNAATGTGRGAGRQVFYVPDVSIGLNITMPTGPFFEGTSYPFQPVLGSLPVGVTVNSYVWTAVSRNGRTVASLSATSNTVPNFAFVPPQGGAYIVKLSVVFSDGRVANAFTSPFQVSGQAPVVSPLSIVSPNVNAIAEGTEVTVSATALDTGEPIGLNYAWELQVPGGAYVPVAGLATKPSVLRFTTNNQGTYNARVTVSDSEGLSAIQTLAINAANTLPEVRFSLVGLAALGSDIVFDAIAKDPSSADQANLTYQWSRDGINYTTSAPDPKRFQTPIAGLTRLFLRVTDDSGSVTRESYLIIGTNGNDVRNITTTDDTNAGSANAIVYLGLDGDDTLVLDPGITKSVVAFGGLGNDTLNASAATLSVTLDGGEGNDSLTGGSGDDILIAGSGTNTLIGGNGNNRFIGGGNDTMTGGIHDDYYEVHFSTVVLNDIGGGDDTVDLTAAPAGVTLDFSQTNNTAQQVFPTSTNADPYFGSTLTLNGTFQKLIGSTYADSLSASTAGIKLFGASGNDTLQATGAGAEVDGGADNDLLVLSNVTGNIVGGAGNDTFTGTLSNSDPTILDGGDGNDIWNVTGPSSVARANVTIVGGSGLSTINASKVRGKITAHPGNATGIVQEFGSVTSNATLDVSVVDSSDVSIFGGVARNNDIEVVDSSDVAIFGGGNDRLRFDGVTLGSTINGGLFGGVTSAGPLDVSVVDSSDVSIFGGSLTDSHLLTTVTDSSDVSIFGGSRSELTVVDSDDVSIFGVSRGSIQVDAPVNSLSTGVNIHISDFGSSISSPVLLLSIADSEDVSIFGTAALNAAPLDISVVDSADVSIFGSASRNVDIDVVDSDDVSIFGVASGTVRLGPVTNQPGISVQRAIIETDGFGTGPSTGALQIAVVDSSDVSIFGTADLNSARMDVNVIDSSDVSIFGSVVGGGIIETLDSDDVSIFAQASSQIVLDHVIQGNVFSQTFGTAQINSRLDVDVLGDSSDVSIFGSASRNAIIEVVDSDDVHIFGGTASNTYGDTTFTGDSVFLTRVTKSTLAGGVFGTSVAQGKDLLIASVTDSDDVSIFGSAKGTSEIIVVDSTDVAIFGGFGDTVDLLDAGTIRIEGGVFGTARANEDGLTVSIVGDSSDVAIFGSNVRDSVTAIGGSSIGIDLRDGNDSVTVSNVTKLVALTDAGNDRVVIHSGSDMLFYLAAGNDQAQVNGGSNIRIIGAEENDELYVAGGSNVDLDGGDGVDAMIVSGGVNLQLRGDAGADVQKLFQNVSGFISGGDGNEVIQFYGNSGTALSLNQVNLVIDGQSGDDTLEIRPAFTTAYRNANNQPSPFEGVPSWIVLPLNIFDPPSNQYSSSIALVGGDGNDTLYLEGNQRLFGVGGDGNDSIMLVGTSASYAVGGDGNDTITIDTNGVDNTIFGDSGNDLITVLNANRLAVYTEEGDDTVQFDGGSQSYARTGTGQDTLRVVAGTSLIVTTDGGDDTIELSGGSDILAGGGADNDTLSILGGQRPIVLGESGSDELVFSSGTEAILSGGDGNDSLVAIGRFASFYGDEGDDNYEVQPVALSAQTSLALREFVFINTDDFESPSRGDDTIDLSAFTTGAILNLGQQGTQNIIAGLLSLDIAGAFESVIGTSAGDILTGTSGRNVLDGRGGNDVLVGLAGEDTLIGDLGDDALDGGDGDDYYSFNTSLGIALGSDVIYEAVDKGNDTVDFAGMPVGLGTWDMTQSSLQSLSNGLLLLSVRRSSLDSSVGDIEEVRGTKFNDALIGNALDNRFELLSGDDTVDGGLGSDIYVMRGSNLGIDTISDEPGNAGRDTLDFVGLDGPVAIDLSLTTPQSQLGLITVILSNGSVIENVIGTSFSDILRGNSLDNAIYGAAGSDLLDGRGGSDRLTAGLPAVVLLDFDSAYDPLRGDFNYSPSERNTIQQNIELDYAGLDWQFTQSESTAKSLTLDSGRSFVRIMFSQGRGGGVSGDAGEVDFRNVNRGVVSEVNINALKPAIADLVGTSDTNASAFRTAAVRLTSTIAAHELAHTAGLRHGDAFGPFGSGLYVNTDTSNIYPPYQGPLSAAESPWHLIASPASIGSTIADANRDLFFGERESIKLEFSETGQSVREVSAAFNGHSSRATAEDLGQLASLFVSNRLPSNGFSNSGKVFEVSALAVVGELQYSQPLDSTEIDYYRFSAKAGEYVNVELLANSIQPLRGSAFDGSLSLYRANGTLLAENDDDFEGTKDATLLDVLIPTDGEYYVSVSRSSQPALAGLGGRYELFLSRFRALNAGSFLPEPLGDTLMGGPGADVLQGGAANDRFIAVDTAIGDLADTLSGGAGYDSLFLHGLDYLYTATSIENIVLENQGPTANLSIVPIGSLNEGGSITVSLLNGFDEYAPDMAAGFRYAFLLKDSLGTVVSGALETQYTNGTASNSRVFLLPDSGTYEVTARIIDVRNGYRDYKNTISVSNLSPTGTISGPENVLRGVPTVFTVTASDASTIDASSLRYSFGSQVSELATSYNAAGTSSTGSIVFPNSGTEFAWVRIFDKDGGMVTLSQRVEVSQIVISEEGGVTRLQAAGSSLGDSMNVRRISTNTFGIKLFKNDTERVFSYGATLGETIEQIEVYALGGNDTVVIDPAWMLPVVVYGGDGDDSIRGGGGSDILVGGAGNDSIYGNGASDLIIGGVGRDLIYGMGDQDIIVAGWTAYDNSLTTLKSILQYWNSDPANGSLAWYQARVAMLRDTGIASGTIRLNTSTTFDDNAADIIAAAVNMPSGAIRKPNWYLRNIAGNGLRDSLLSATLDEISTDNGDGP
jgi:hypothetical protein